jgi:hypothetical protein
MFKSILFGIGAGFLGIAGAAITPILVGILGAVGGAITIVGLAAFRAFRKVRSQAAATAQ